MSDVKELPAIPGLDIITESSRKKGEIYPVNEEPSGEDVQSGPSDQPVSAEPATTSTSSSTYKTTKEIGDTVDVAIVGGGISGLATAIALLAVLPKLKIRVFEKRAVPEHPYGATVRLEPNGLHAVEAISKKLYKRLIREGIPGQRVLLHDTDAGGTIISRLEAPTASPRGHLPESPLSLVLGWYEIEEVLLSMLPSSVVVNDVSFLEFEEMSDGVVLYMEGLPHAVKAGVVVACDGPRSTVRRQLLHEDPPTFDNTVKWSGRLAGDLLSTTPLEYDAWWLKPGQVMMSHPMKGHDVGWEAVVNVQTLMAKGYKWDEQTGRVVPTLEGHPGKQVDILLDLFSDFPTAVSHMLLHTDTRTIICAPVYIRHPRDLPSLMGRGHIVLLGEAAHPLRPTGQDENQAFEDAVELALAVQQHGLSLRALRSFEQKRWPRWKHVMQVTMAHGTSTLVPVGLRQGVLDYTSDLHKVRFKPLRPEGPITLGAKVRRMLGALALAYAVATAGQALHHHLRRSGAIVSDDPLTSLQNTVAQAVGATRTLLEVGKEKVGEGVEEVVVVVERPKEALSLMDRIRRFFGRKTGEVGLDMGLKVAQVVGQPVAHAAERRVAKALGAF